MAELRRGLPRVPGGEAWPPAGVVAAFDVASSGGVNEGVAPAARRATVPPADVATASAPRATDDGAFRRGLPRTPGGEPWPPAEAAPRFTVAAPPVSSSAAAPDRAEAETKGLKASVEARVGASSRSARSATGLRRGLPRVVGGEPWPPADAAATFQVALPQAFEAPLPVAERGEAATTRPTEAVDVSETVAPPRPAIAQPRRIAPVRRKPARFTGDQVFGALVALVAGGATLAVLGTAVVFLVRMFLFNSPAGADFLRAFPGESRLPDWAPVGFPAWVQWQHWLNAFFILLVIKTGLAVRNTQRPAAMWAPRRKGKRISIELWSHLALDVLWLANGVIFWILLFATGQWVRVIPTSWDVFPNALSAALQYVSLSWPTEDGWVNYNALQVLAYFVTIFLAAPIAAITGFRMSPLWPAKAERLSRAYPVELARALHFPTMIYFVAFVVVHVVLVLATGALRNLNHMFWGSDDTGSWAGFWMFVLGVVVIVGGWFAARPAVMKYVGSAFGKVGR